MLRYIAVKVREPANGLTHIAGVVLAIIAMGILLRIAIATHDPPVLIGLSLFGLSQIALYTASALYHSLTVSPLTIARLERFDCMMVVIFIAATYTPVCLLALHGIWRWGLLSLVWALALGGLGMMASWMRAPRWLSTGIYVALGWVGLLAAPALFRSLPPDGMAWMLAGGAVYTVGALIFLCERPNLFPGRFEAHALWHCFVLAGSACCFWLIVRYVVPLA